MKSTPRIPKFENLQKTRFLATLKHEVNQYFTILGTDKYGDYRLYIKAALFLILFGVEYAIWLTTPSLGLRCIMAVLLGLTLGAIGFNIMHDANHGSFSSKKWVNNLFGLTLNLMNGYAPWWKKKHNIFHHSYTNIVDADEDIAIPLMRVHREQVRKSYHRRQQWYWPLMYAMTYIAWIFINDFRRIVIKKVGPHVITVAKKEWLWFAISKSLSMTFWIIIPIVVMGWQHFLISYSLLGVVCGFFIAIVFQLAHVVENTAQPILVEYRSPDEWALHQLATTSNFACNNRYINWICGGLNFQVEHHLLPEVSHVHYPALSRIVKKLCIEFGIPYNEYPTFGAAVASHRAVLTYLGSHD